MSKRRLEGALPKSMQRRKERIARRRGKTEARKGELKPQKVNSIHCLMSNINRVTVSGRKVAGAPGLGILRLVDWTLVVVRWQS